MLGRRRQMPITIEIRGRSDINWDWYQVRLYHPNRPSVSICFPYGGKFVIAGLLFRSLQVTPTKEPFFAQILGRVDDDGKLIQKARPDNGFSA